MDKRIILALTAAASGTVGGFIGFKIASERLVKKFDAILEAELANTKKFYERKNKVGDFATPEAAVETLGIPDGPAEEAADAMVNYAAMHIPGGAAVITNDGILVPEGPLEEDPLARETAKNVFGKEPGEPVLISFDEFAQIGDEYDQLSVTYYMGDKIVAEMDDSPIADDDRCVGLDNLHKFHEDEAITQIYVRNDRLKIVYEITRSTGKYSKEVLDLDDDGHLEHAETFERRPRRRQVLRDE
jgi:hypothetical protein